jgi:hypothetical protein
MFFSIEINNTHAPCMHLNLSHKFVFIESHFNLHGNFLVWGIESIALDTLLVARNGMCVSLLHNQYNNFICFCYKSIIILYFYINLS